MTTGADAPDFVEVVATACCVLFLRTATLHSRATAIDNLPSYHVISGTAAWSLPHLRH